MGERARLGDRFELGPPIGSGGFGTVFRARDRATDTDVAVKVVPRGFGSEVLAARLAKEAELLARLVSRHVARIVASGDDAAHGTWLAMELVEGVPLTPAAIGRALLPHEVLRVARGLLGGLRAAHEAGIVHGDVKPANVLVPLGTATLDSAKLIDFGLGRVTSRAAFADEIGSSAPREGVVLGTARFMAPEVLLGAAVGPRADLYGAGLVLFDLLGVGELFAGGLADRVKKEPELGTRVPAPLADVLARMLARDPQRRWASAIEAHDAVMDLDTAPVAIVDPGDVPTSVRRVTFPPPPAVPAPVSVRPQPASAPRPIAAAVPTQPPLPVLPRLTRLDGDAVTALRDALRHLDLPMLDALARRERGSLSGRIARGTSLSLRLELDAAALVLEPLTNQSAVARAIGATILAPRARRITRARVDSDRADEWIAGVPLDLAAILAAVAAAIGAREDASRDVRRCARILDVLGRMDPDLETTLRIAHAAARVKSGELDAGSAFDLVAPLGANDTRAVHRLERIVRSLCIATIAAHADEQRERQELERASIMAADTGATLIDACAATALGMALADAATRVDDGLAMLERATTLLGHGDAPGLEHEAEHRRAAVLVAQAKWADAIPRLRAAREAAHNERALEAELTSASLEVVAHLAGGDRGSAHETALVLGDARIASASARAAAFAWVARSLDALAAGDVDGAEDALTEAEARVRETGAAAEGVEPYVLVEVLGMLFDAARGALPDAGTAIAELERFVHERGFTAFHWFDVLAAVVGRLDDAPARDKMHDVLDRIRRGVRQDRRTSAPPPVSMRDA